MQLSITDLEAERKRREFARIEHAVRVGGALPKPEFKHGRCNIDICFGPVKIVLWSEIGQDVETKETTVHVSNGKLEQEIFKLFPDKDVTKKLYDHVLVALEKYVEGNDGKLVWEGDAKFCG